MSDTAFKKVQKASGSQAFYSSLVVEHIVTKSQKKAFKRWHSLLEKAARRYPGFVRLDLNSPLFCEDEMIKWYSIIHFDSPEHLNGWMNSDARKRVVAKGQDVFRAYRFKSFTTGLEGWFSQRGLAEENKGLGPPVWKQILAVVFGLYPIVMIRIKLFPGTGVIGDWSPAGAMLFATICTSSILAIAVMPMVTKLMRFWLYPAYQETKWRADVVGALMMGLGLVFMAGVFDSV